MPVQLQDPTSTVGRSRPPRRAARNHDPCETMSNATHEARNPGDNKRRRNRGGRNRNQNRNSDHRERDPQGDRQSGGNRQPGRQDTRPARKYSPPKLSWWQKLLKAVGLYKEPAPPVRPERPERSEENVRTAAEPRRDGRGPKSNTRNARNSEGGETATDEERPRRQREPRGERPPRGEREPREAREPRERRGGDRNSVESPRVYVGNLSYDVTEEDLKDLFKGVGPVRNVEIVYNRSTHRSKGYGFVEMLHMDEAMRAVEVLHDQPFMGRKLTVSGAKSKGQDEREDQEDREDRAKPAVMPVLAPLPVAAVAESAVIVEETTSLMPEAELEVHEDAQSVEDDLPLVPGDVAEPCAGECACSTSDPEPDASKESAIN